MRHGRLALSHLPTHSMTYLLNHSQIQLLNPYFSVALNSHCCVCGCYSWLYDVGEIPASLGQLTSLTMLILYGNQLSGEKLRPPSVCLSLCLSLSISLCPSLCVSFYLMLRHGRLALLHLLAQSVTYAIIHTFSF